MIIRLLLQLLQLSFPAPDKSVCPAPVQLHCVVASPLRPQQLRGLAQDAPTPHPIPPLIWRGGCPSSAQLCPALAAHIQIEQRPGGWAGGHRIVQLGSPDQKHAQNPSHRYLHSI